jgi:hypothetical protein
MESGENSVLEKYPARDDCYVYCFCEENVFRLIEALLRENTCGPLFAVFVSNECQSVAFHSHGSDCVVWDYHVVCVLKRDENWLVFDASAGGRLSWPVELDVWLQESFSNLEQKRFAPKFRIVDAKTLVENFSSDRSHMLDSEVPFPSYSPIVRSKTSRHNLFSHFVTMNENEGFGIVGTDLKKLLKEKEKARVV